jgi:hypothetical protein
VAAGIAAHDTAAMLDQRPRLWRNPASWYVFAGLALIVLTSLTPLLLATRTARVETRADHLAEFLLQASRDLSPPFDAAAGEHCLASWLALAAAGGVFVGDLEPFPEAASADTLAFVNKHYLFRVRGSPPPATSAVGTEAPSLEVLAWPQSMTSPAHCVYFYPSNAGRAYTRNLTAGYEGLTKPPPPGCGHRRLGPSNESSLAYRGEDDERWVLY